MCPDNKLHAQLTPFRVTNADSIHYCGQAPYPRTLGYRLAVAEQLHYSRLAGPQKLSASPAKCTSHHAQLVLTQNGASHRNLSNNSVGY
jgi:hypothetical protein